MANLGFVISTSEIISLSSKLFDLIEWYNSNERIKVNKVNMISKHDKIIFLFSDSK